MDRIPATTIDERVLVVAPTPLDAQFCRNILGEAKLNCVICDGMPVLERELGKGGGAILLTDAVFSDGGPEALSACLRRQPEWSDIPILLLAGGGLASPRAVWLMELLGNVTVLDRPVRVITLVSALRSAIKARRRQYELRDRLLLLRNTEATLRASERQFRELVETAMEGIWQVDADGKTTYVNQRICDMLGVEPHRMIGTTVSDFMGPEDQARLPEVWGRHARGEHEQSEWRLRRADGEWIWVLTSAAPILGEDRTVIGAFAMLTDITSRRHAEEEVREASRRKDEFVATLAHELRNPLAPIRHALDALRLGAHRGAVDTGVIGMMDRQVSHMVRLIDELLEVSRITRGTIELQREPSDFRAILKSAMEASMPLLEANQHKVTVSLPDAPITLNADSVRLEQVFTNVLNNAAKFTNPNGAIDITAEVDDASATNPHLVVRIRDNGIGMEQEHITRVFEMFSQATPAVGNFSGGLGIGLALAKALVELHGGTISASSAGRGRGSEFTIRLPLATQQTRRATHPSRQSPKLDLDGMRILIVDDNADAADSLVILLRLAGAEAHSTHDGAEGLAVARAWRPDVALLDIGMPGMNGLEVAAQMRSDPSLAHCTIVALTGWGKQEDRLRSLEAGMHHHLVKPVDFDALGRLLREIRDGKAAAAPASPVASPPVSGRRVLVVDDHVDSGESLAILLRHAGHLVEVSHDGHDALRKVESFDPEVVALDLGLPDIDGFEVARRVRALEHASHPMLIALTGFGGSDVTRQAHDAGFDHHAVKPVDINQLLQLIAGR